VKVAIAAATTRHRPAAAQEVTAGAQAMVAAQDTVAVLAQAVPGLAQARVNIALLLILLLPHTTHLITRRID
jgi:hypothetical protein